MSTLKSLFSRLVWLARDGFRSGRAFYVLMILLLCPAAAVHAADPVIIDESAAVVEVGNRLDVVRDPNSLLDVSGVTSAAWQPLAAESSGANFGFTSGTVWLRMVVRNASAQDLQRFVEIGYPVLDDIRVYLERDGAIAQQWALGDKHPYHSRPIGHRTFIVPVTLPSGSDTVLYYQVSSTSSLQVPLTIWDNDSLMSHMQNQYHAYGLYFGAMLVLMFYNLFLFFSIREPHYFFYVMYVAAVCLFTASINGISFQYLWPDATDWNDHSTLVGLGLIIVFAGFFTQNFLDMQREHPVLGQMLKWTIALAAAETAAVMFLPYRTSVMLLIITAVWGITLAMSAGVLMWNQGSRPAMIYCIAWFSFLLAGVVLALNKIGVMPRNLFTENALQIGAAIEGVLLSIALADRLNEEKARRFQAQRERLEHERIAREAQAETLVQEKNARLAQERALLHERTAREAQAHALRLQQRANETLEQKVRERTEELEQLNAKLRELSLTDGLTGLHNRRYFDRRLDELLQRSIMDSTPMALLLLDIDRFKALNDQYGHLVGDDCLKLVASILASQVHRDDDTVTRYGGEEFALLLPHTDEAGALHIAEKVRQAIESMPFREGEHTIPITVSIGVRCLLPDGDADAHTVIEQADQALYAAKSSGRNKVCLFAA